MNQKPWIEDDEFALELPNTSARSYGPRDRLVLGAKALFLGVAAAHLTFCVFWGLLAPPCAVMFFIYSLLPVWAVGYAAGALLGLALRRIRNQWLHVAGFFGAGLLMCAPFGGFSATGPLVFTTSVALAAAVGRLAVWKYVRIINPYSRPPQPRGT